MRLLPLRDPCSLRFASLRGEGATRSCNQCGKQVHDLSSRTEEEARALLDAAGEGEVCVRFLATRDGRIRFRVAAVATALVVGSSGLALAAGGEPAATQPAPATRSSGDAGPGDAGPDVVEWMGRK
jgi:hypothetical protein